MKFRTFVIVLAVALAAAVYFLGIRPREKADRNLEALVSAKPSVMVTFARKASASNELLLPGTLQPFVDTAIRARTSGYVGRWFADIGDHVKAGQTLATIESPEIDQQLKQGRANSEQAKANLAIAKLSAERWKALGAQNAVAQQDVDQKTADLAARQADVAAAEANVQRLAQLQDFETVTAPFDGVISIRNVDTGSLVTADAGSELFHLTQSDTLRAYVNVPQAYVPDIKVGLAVNVLVAEFPRQVFAGKVTRHSGALDPASRTLLVEVQIPNKEARLYAGMFCQFQFNLSPEEPSILIPSNDAIIRAEGTRVAVVTPDGKIHLQRVKLGRDFGTQIQVLSGLPDGARVVDNPSDSLSEGEVVTAVALPGAGKAN